MIIEYHRPKTISEALTLLAREQPPTYALGGGTYINRNLAIQYAVVDLQDLGLGEIKVIGNQAQVGATVKLQELLDLAGLPEDIYTSIRYEVTYNLRQMATVAGTLVTANGRSPFTTALLALDASLDIQELGSVSRKIKLGNWLPLRGQVKFTGLITRISFPINLKLAYEYVARTPADQPIVCAAIAHWNSGRTRLALGGWGEAPILAMDGPEAAGIESAGRNAYSHAGDDWASAEYRQEMAGVLAVRGLQRSSAS
jgi:CO/xanthine dehydrogenase FAD-binding subunit